MRLNAVSSWLSILPAPLSQGHLHTGIQALTLLKTSSANTTRPILCRAALPRLPRKSRSPEDGKELIDEAIQTTIRIHHVTADRRFSFRAATRGDRSETRAGTSAASKRQSCGNQYRDISGAG